jgi:hypothetical protein
MYRYRGCLTGMHDSALVRHVFIPRSVTRRSVRPKIVAVYHQVPLVLLVLPLAPEI